MFKNKNKKYCQDLSPSSRKKYPYYSNFPLNFYHKIKNSLNFDWKKNIIFKKIFKIFLLMSENFGEFWLLESLRSKNNFSIFFYYDKKFDLPLRDKCPLTTVKELNSRIFNFFKFYYQLFTLKIYITGT